MDRADVPERESVEVIIQCSEETDSFLEASDLQLLEEIPDFSSEDDMNSIKQAIGQR